MPNITQPAPVVDEAVALQKELSNILYPYLSLAGVDEYIVGNTSTAIAIHICNILKMRGWHHD